jgi:hypothetical protein
MVTAQELTLTIYNPTAERAASPGRLSLRIRLVFARAGRIIIYVSTTVVKAMNFIASNCLPSRSSNLGIRLRLILGGVLLSFTQLAPGQAIITSPTNPPVRAVAAVYKPGGAIHVVGTADGAAFQRFYVEWAKGINPFSGWTNSGVTLTGGGLSPITDGMLASWNSGTITQADFYSIRLRVEETGATNLAGTYVYLEPDLYSTNWPQWLDQAPGNSCLLPARIDSGQTRLVLVNPPYLSTTLPSRLWQFSADGASLTTNTLDRGSYMQPAVGNLDGAGGDEIIVAEWNQLRIFCPDGSTIILPRSNNANLQHVLVTLVDLDGDGQTEILALGSNLANSDGWLYAWKTNGQMFNANYPLLVPDADFNLRSLDRAGRILPVDLNADGIPELLVLTSEASGSFSLRMFHADGSPADWPAITLGGQYFQAVAGDLDRDGLPEIVVAYEDGDGLNRLAAYSTQGTLLPGWPLQVGSGTPMHALLADLNRDGTNEIIATAFAGLFVFKADGTKFSGSWPVQGNGFQPFSMPSVADIDGDGIAEILVVRNDTVFSSPFYTDLNLIAYRTNASIARSWRLFGANGNQPTWGGPPLVGDFDGDGQVDLALNYQLVTGGGTSGGLQQGVVTVLRLKAPYRPNRRDWPMYYHDPRNSSIGFLPATLNLARTTTGVALSWPLQSDLGIVQYKADLGSGVWVPLTDTPSLTNGQHRIELPLTNSARLFRLHYP